MINRISLHLTDYILAKGRIEDSEYSIYRYGFALSIEAILVTSFCLILALFGGINMFIYGITFFLTFIPLRRYGGGYHLAKFRNCFFLSTISYGSILLGASYLKANLYVVSFSYALLFFLYLIGPIFTSKDKFNNERKRICQVRFHLTLLVIGIVMSLLYIEGYNGCVTVISLTLVLNAVSLIFKAKHI